MAKLTDAETRALEEHDEKVLAAIKAADLDALDALHEQEDIQKLKSRQRFHLADKTTRDLWEQHKGEHVVFRVCRSIVRLMLYSSDVEARTMQRRVAEMSELVDQLAPLYRRVEELEKEAIRYAGTFETGKAYGQGQAVTHANSLWICRRATCSRPGTDDSWKLASRGAKR